MCNYHINFTICHKNTSENIGLGRTREYDASNISLACFGFNVDCLNSLSKFPTMIHNQIKSIFKSPFNYYINLESSIPSISWQWDRIPLHYNPQLNLKCPALCQQIASIKTQKPTLILTLLQPIVEALSSFQSGWLLHTMGLQNPRRLSDKET